MLIHGILSRLERNCRLSIQVRGTVFWTTLPYLTTTIPYHIMKHGPAHTVRLSFTMQRRLRTLERLTDLHDQLA